MAQHFVAAIYATGTRGGTSEGGLTGTYFSFPVENSIFYSSNAQYGSVTTKSIIEVLPSGLTVKGKTYYTDRTVDQLNTLANA